MDFRQYNHPVVQAAQIIRVPRPLLDAVEVRDERGRQIVITHIGLFEDGVPVVGDWLVLWPSGRATCISNDEWARSEYEQVRGPVLT